MNCLALRRCGPPIFSPNAKTQDGSKQQQPKPRSSLPRIDITQNRSLVKPSRRSLLVSPALICCSCGCGKAAAATDGTHNRNGFLDQVFAEAMYSGMTDYESAISPVKTRLFSQLQPSKEGELLEVAEIGCGTGPNLPYYNKNNTKITAVDPNNYMLPFLKKNMTEQGWAEDSISWKAGVAESLPLEDSSVDAVVCTLVLCSVTDVVAVIAEVKRVLRPGGKLLFIEHTVAGPEAGTLLRVAQYALNPLQRLFADGCNLIRDPLPQIEGAGFKNVDSMRFKVDGFNLIGPHVAGIATMEEA